MGAPQVAGRACQHVQAANKPTPAPAHLSMAAAVTLRRLLRSVRQSTPSYSTRSSAAIPELQRSAQSGERGAVQGGRKSVEASVFAGCSNGDAVFCALHASTRVQQPALLHGVSWPGKLHQNGSRACMHPAALASNATSALLPTQRAPQHRHARLGSRRQPPLALSILLLFRSPAQGTRGCQKVM